MTAVQGSPLFAVNMTRDKFWQWRWQWSVLTLFAVVLMLYNGVANVWLLAEPRCQSPAAPTKPTPPPPPCAPCDLLLDDVGASRDDPIADLDLRLGRWDASRSYRLFDAAAVGDSYADLSAARRVCLATQTSIERMHELVRIAAHWSGPISVAVFVAGDELRLLRGFVTWLYHCEPQLYARLALHVASAGARAGGAAPAWSRECGAVPAVAADRASDTVQWRAKHPYPQNHMRNLARKHCQSQYVFLVDVDIVPSQGMAEALDDFLTRTPRCPMCAYVVPTYELDYGVASFPANKSELLRLSRRKLALPYHRKVFIYNQYASNLSRWEASGGNESSETHVSHNVTNFKFFYEPFYVAPDTVPPHDERFLGYGYTRNTQVYEMFMMGYQFCVLSPIFTIHWGLQRRRYRPLWREQQKERNRNFQTFKREIFARYRKDPLHLLHRPPVPKKT